VARLLLIIEEAEELKNRAAVGGSWQARSIARTFLRGR
jgi:hypothetical protein